MIHTHKQILITIFSAALSVITLSASAAEVAGTVDSISGRAIATNASGDARILMQGSKVSAGDTIETSSDSETILTLSDDSEYILREDTLFSILAYEFSGTEDGTEIAHFKIDKGALQATSGQIGRTYKNRYRLDTPKSSIGIRGTVYRVEVIRTPSGQIRIRVATLDGAIVYSSAGNSGVNSPLPFDSTTLEVETDDLTGEVESIILTAGNRLSESEKGEVRTAVGNLGGGDGGDPTGGDTGGGDGGDPFGGDDGTPSGGSPI